MILCIHGLQLSHYIATVDHTGKESDSLQVSPFLTYLSWCAMRTFDWASSLLLLRDSLFIWGNRPLIGMLNNSMAGVGSPVHMGADLIYNRARFTLLLVSRHFVIVHLTNFMYTLTWPLSGGDRMMLWSALCSSVYKTVWTSQMWNLCLHLKQISLGVQIQQIQSVPLLPDHPSRLSASFIIGNLL